MDKKIYIMLSRTGTYFSRAIGFFTKAPYNHASIALDENLNFLYSFGRRNLYLPILAGFIKEDLNSGIYKIYTDTHCQIYCISVSEIQYHNITLLIKQFEESYNKYHYNFFGLIMMLFNIPFRRQYHYVCSQFVAYILEECEIVDFNTLLEKDASLIRPHDLSALPNCNLIYSGKLIDYTL